MANLHQAGADELANDALATDARAGFSEAGGAFALQSASQQHFAESVALMRAFNSIGCASDRQTVLALARKLAG
jgi:hypothetical protein